jgi:methyl-accepting chemotaxis protein
VHARRYALLGALAGFFFPALATLIEAQLHHQGNLLAAQAGSPLLWIVDTAPVILAFLAWMVGSRQDQVLELEEARAGAYVRTAQDLSAAATALFQSVSAFSAMTADTAAAVQEVTQTMTALSHTAMRAALTAETVIGLAQKSARSSEEGLKAVDTTTAGMAKLAEDANGWAARTQVLSGKMRDVSAIAAVMGHLAERSQGLAAEARAEALRAGEAGAGFGRVAGEMQSHAADASGAAAKVRQLVAEMEQAVAAALAAVEQGRQDAAAHAAAAAGTGRTIRALAGTIRDSSGAAKEIATVAQQQDRGIEEALKAMNGIFLSVQEAVSQTARVAAQARGLSDLAAGMKGTSPEGR